MSEERQVPESSVNPSTSEPSSPEPTAGPTVSPPPSAPWQTESKTPSNRTFAQRHPFLFGSLLVVAVVVLVAVGSKVAYGDTILLKNDRTIYAESAVVGPVVVGQNEDGEPILDPRTFGIPKGKVRLLFSNGGWMDIPVKKVKMVVENDKDAFKNHNFILKVKK